MVNTRSKQKQYEQQLEQTSQVQQNQQNSLPEQVQFFQSEQNKNVPVDTVDQDSFTEFQNPTASSTQQSSYSVYENNAYDETAHTTLKRMSQVPRNQTHTKFQNYQQPPMYPKDTEQKERDMQKVGTSQQYNHQVVSQLQEPLEQEEIDVGQYDDKLSPEEIKNSQFLNQTNTPDAGFSKPSKNERLTKVEKQVSHVSQQLSQQKLAQQEQARTTQQSLDRVFDILKGLKQTYSNVQNNTQVPSEHHNIFKPHTAFQNIRKTPGMTRMQPFVEGEDTSPPEGYKNTRPTANKLPNTSPGQIQSNKFVSGYRTTDNRHTQPIQVQGEYVPITRLEQPPETLQASSAQNQGLNPQQIIVKMPRTVSLRNYSGEDNPSAWIKLFVKHCTRMEVHTDDFLDEVRDYLVGRALSFYERNYDKFGESFDVFKMMFVNAFYKDPDVIETQLFITRQNENEDLRSYLRRLETIARPACLDEGRIRLALIQGIKDKELATYARQTYLFLHKDKPLEQIIISLIDYENTLKNSRRTNTVQQRTPYSYNRDQQNGPRPYYNSNQGQNIQNRSYQPKSDLNKPNTSERNNRNQQGNRPPVKANIAQEEIPQEPQQEQVVTKEDIQEIDEGEDQEQYYLQGNEAQNSIFTLQEISTDKFVNFQQKNAVTDQQTDEQSRQVEQTIQSDLQYFQNCLGENSLKEQTRETLKQTNTSDLQAFRSPLYNRNQEFTGQGQLSCNKVYNQNSPFKVINSKETRINESVNKCLNSQQVQIFSIDDQNLTQSIQFPNSVLQNSSVSQQTNTQSSIEQKQQISNTGMKVYELNPNHVLRYINIKINDINVNALVDTGCTSVVVTLSFIEGNNLLYRLVQKYRQLTTVIDTTVALRNILPQGQITFFQEELQNIMLVADMLVVASNPSFEVIIGQSFLNFFIYQVTINGLQLKLQQQGQEVFVPYVADLVYHISETDTTGLDVLFKDSTLLSKEQQELYPNFPTDKRDIILIDPPWTYFRNVRDIRTPQYQQLTFQELLRLPIKEISKDDGIFLIWVTSPMFRQALQLIQAYGFMYKTILFVWVKLDENNQPQEGKGNYTFPCCEYLVLATKGQFVKFLQPDIKVSQLFEAQNLKRSRKPTKVYALLLQVFRLNEFNNFEIFSSQPQGSELFSHYGNNVPNRYQQSLNIPTETLNFLNETTYHNEQTEQTFTTSQTDQSFITQEELLEQYEQEQLLSKDEVLSQVKVHSSKYSEFLKTQVSVFSRGDSDLGQTDVITHKIQLKPDSIPKRQRPYRTGHLENKAIEEIVSSIEKIGVIKSEPSPYQHPIVLVLKPNGKYRMCINYKYLNSQTLDDKYPIPLISLLFTRLASARVFTKLDGKSGFWQVQMDPESIPLTGFVTHNGQYVYLRMPFGLKNAPATFQRLMNEILKDFINEGFVIVYIDDIIVCSADEYSHITHLQLVFDRLRSARIKLGADKCEIGFPSMNILGHTVMYNEIKPQKEKVEAIYNISIPATVTELRSFLGLCSYYRQYIPNFAKIANVLFPLIGKNVPFTWEEKHSVAFQQLKQTLAQNSVLGLLQNDKPLVLYTDFSTLGLGAVLTQKVSDRKEKVIEYASRTLQKYERSLDSYCGEVLAVYWAINKFRQYVLSVPFSLEIVTDNKALEWVLKLGTSSPIRKIQRWTMEIDSYAYHVRHRKGSTHVNADALSRLVGQIPTETQPTVASKGLDSQLYMEDLGDVACKQCRSPHENDHMAICDRCGDANHLSCINVQVLTPGPFYCPDCTHIIKNLPDKDKDVIYNQKLYQYLHLCTGYQGNEFDSKEIESLNLSTAEHESFQNFCLYHDRLFRKDSNNQYLLVPTPVERQIILKEQHHLCGHGGISRTTSKVQEQYWWKGMHKDIKNFIKSCEICNVTSPTFSQQPELHPIQKGFSPFQVLSADLITNLQDSTSLTTDIHQDPLTDEQVINLRAKNQRKKRASTKKPKTKKKPGRKSKQQIQQDKQQQSEEEGEEPQTIYKHCIVVVDVFSKYVELGALRTKSSDEIYKWFDQRVICRYGSPYILRTDQGTEFMGGLKILCEDHNIEMRKISSHHPQANGQAEAIVKIVTNILRKFLLSKHYQYLNWWDILPYVQRSINISKTTATSFTPHEILYGRKICQTDSVNYTLKEFQENFVDLSPQEIDQYMTQLQSSLEDLQNRVKIQLRKQDDRMIQSYDRKDHKEFEFQKGQRVYLQKLRTNKLEPKVLGPYIFQKYSQNRLQADVINPDTGKTMRFNTNTLSPASIIQYVYF